MTGTEATELLAEGWELIRRNMILGGMRIPDFIKFQVEGANHIRATRAAELDELAKAIAAIEEDIQRLDQGAPPWSIVTQTSSACDRKGMR